MNKMVYRVYAIACALLILITYNSSAQDARFAQYYAAPLYLNPALTGAYQGSYKVAAIYRDQWRGAYSEPLQTFAISGDVRFDVGSNLMGKKDAAAGGIIFLSDRVNLYDFNTTFVGFSGAYHKLLNKRKNTFLSAGMRFAMINRSVNFENLSFQDEFNGINEYIFDTKENLPYNSYTYPDLSLGLNFTTNPDDKKHFSMGIALDHILSNNISFYKNEDVDPSQPALEKSISLFKKLFADVQYTFPFNRYSQLGPRVAVLVQGPFQEISIGSIYRYSNPGKSRTGIQFGIWGRGNNYLESYNLASVAGMFGVELNNILFALSYETNVTEFSSLGAQRDAFELSVTFIGNYENDLTFCPKF